jgi:pyruvate/2-oxoglutarate dehydrogenase complex dihydrolipoamide acyltransferase (E2) component
MNKYYFIIPVGLLIGFIFVYRGTVKDIQIREETIKAAAAAKAATEDAQRQEIEKKAEEDARAQAEKRAAEEKAKQEKKDNDYKNAMAQLKGEADGYSAEADKLAKESAELELDLTKSRSLRDKDTSEAFDLTKQVELAKISRRNAELEIQRLIEMVATRAASSSLTAMPVPPPPPAK